MKEAGNIIVAFVLSIAQFIIGVMIIADKADIHTIGIYYIFGSCFTVLVAILAAFAVALRNSK